MIIDKLDIAFIIKSISELEKLKLLLFDEDQYYLFEHIPKPFLVDTKSALRVCKKEEKNDEESPMSKKKEKKKDENLDVFMSSNRFWQKSRLSEEKKIELFCKALYNIKVKEENGNLNVIDKRLLKILKLYSGNGEKR